jgi:hypothetical protein
MDLGKECCGQIGTFGCAIRWEIMLEEFRTGVHFLEDYEKE